MTDSPSLTAELQRKSIHIITAIVPIMYLLKWDREPTLILSFVLFLGFFGADLLRINFPLARKYFLRVFSSLLREGELEGKFTGATYLFAGMTLSFYLFNKSTATAAVLVLCLADPAAAVFGRRFGTKRFAGKSFAGSAAFGIIALSILLLIFGIVWTVVLVAFAAAITELLPIKINDNLSIPLVTGILLQILV